MRIHTYSAGTQGALTHPDVPPETCLRELVTVEVDEVVFRVGNEAELDVELSVVELFGAEPGHVIVHHCHEIAVAVSYAGTEKRLTVHPATSVNAVRTKAIAAFSLDAGSSADLILRLQGSTEELPTTNPIGVYVPKGSCALALDLVHLLRPQG